MRETTKNTNENEAGRYADGTVQEFNSAPRLNSSAYLVHFENGATMGFAVGHGMAYGNTNKMRVSSPTRNVFDYLVGADELVGKEMTFRARKVGEHFPAREFTVLVTAMRDGGRGTGRTTVSVKVVSSREL
jgi:hypothetical protein